VAVGGTVASGLELASAGRPTMTFIPRGWSAAARCLAGTTILSLLLVLPARGIEMFTYFGDGSRIGLPSLEVPVQAYPGIPLRSDRIRARARAQQLRRAAPVDQPGTPPGDGLPGIPGGGITVRPMATPAVGPVPGTRTPPTVGRFPQAPPPSAAPSSQPTGENWSNLVPGGRSAPEQITAPPPANSAPNPTLPGFSQPVFPGSGPATNRAPGAGRSR
jgi:hypothetical protein